MIADATLSDEIASEAADLRASFPKGATPHDLAGWFAQPLPRIEEALTAMREAGADLSFVRLEPEKNPAAVLMGKAGGRARAQKVDAERRAAIASEAARTRWDRSQDRREGLNDFKASVKANGGAINLAVQEAMKRGPYNPKDPEQPTAKEFRNQFIRALSDLAKRYPDGVTVRQIMDYFCVDEGRVRYLLNSARNEGWCKVIRTRTEARGHQGVYLFAGMMEAAPEMTERQEQVYRWLAERTDKDGEVTAPMNEMSRDLKMSDGTAFGHIGGLEKKGYLQRLTKLSERDANGVPISPRFVLYDAPDPQPVQVLRPKLHEPDKHPADKQRGYSTFLLRLVEHRNGMKAELDRIDGIIASYFGADDIERAKRDA